MKLVVPYIERAITARIQIRVVKNPQQLQFIFMDF